MFGLPYAESSSRTRLRRSNKKEQSEKAPISPGSSKPKRLRSERSSGDYSEGKSDLGSGTSGDDRSTAQKRAREAVSDDGGPVARTRAKRKKYHSIVPVDDAMAAKMARRRSRTRIEAAQAAAETVDTSTAEASTHGPSQPVAAPSTTYVTYTPQVTTVGGWHVPPSKKVPSGPSTRSHNPFPQHSPRHHHRAFQCQSPTTFQGALSSPNSDGNETFSSFSSESLGLSELTLNVDNSRGGRCEDLQPNSLLPTLLKSHLDLLRSLDESEEELRRDRSSLPVSQIPPSKGRLAGPTMLQMLKGEKSQITDSSSSEGGGSGSTPLNVLTSSMNARRAYREAERRAMRERKRCFEDSGLGREGESDNDEDNELRIPMSRDRSGTEGSNGGRSSSSAGSGIGPELPFSCVEHNKLPPICYDYRVDDIETHGSPAGSSHTPSPRQTKSSTFVTKFSISPQYYPHSSLAFEDHRSEADSESPSQGSSFLLPTLPCALQFAAPPPLAQPIAIGGHATTFAKLLGSDLNQGPASRLDTASWIDSTHLPNATSTGLFFSSRSAFAPKVVPQPSN